MLANEIHQTLMSRSMQHRFSDIISFAMPKEIIATFVSSETKVMHTGFFSLYCISMAPDKKLVGARVLLLSLYSCRSAKNNDVKPKTHN